MSGNEFELEKVHWTSIRGNPYNRKIHVIMLFGNYERTIATSKLKGEGKYHEGRTRTVIYDREYALAKVINEVFEPLARLDDEVIDEFLAEAKRRFRDGQN